MIMSGLDFLIGEEEKRSGEKEGEDGERRRLREKEGGETTTGKGGETGRREGW